MTDTLIRIGQPTEDAPEGLAPVATMHYRPEALAEAQRRRFDRRLELPHPGRVPGQQIRLFVHPKTLGVAWYARTQPEEEDGEPGPWSLMLNVDLE